MAMGDDHHDFLGDRTDPYSEERHLMNDQPGEISEQPPEVLPPVEWIPTDKSKAPPAPGIALCLSGGGY